MAFTALRLKDQRVISVDEVVAMSCVSGRAYLVHMSSQHTGLANSHALVWEYQLTDDCRPMGGGGCGYGTCSAVRDQFLANMMASGWIFTL